MTLKLFACGDVVNLTSNNIEEIVSSSNRNIGKLLVILEMSMIDGAYSKYTDPINKKLNELVKLICQKKVSKVPEIREKIKWTKTTCL